MNCLSSSPAIFQSVMMGCSISPKSVHAVHRCANRSWAASVIDPCCLSPVVVKIRRTTSRGCVDCCQFVPIKHGSQPLPLKRSRSTLARPTAHRTDCPSNMVSRVPFDVLTPRTAVTLRSVARKTINAWSHCPACRTARTLHSPQQM